MTVRLFAIHLALVSVVAGGHIILGGLISCEFGLEFGHCLATGHQIGDFFSSSLTPAKVIGLAPMDEDSKVIPGLSWRG